MLKKSTILFACAVLLMAGTQEVTAGCPGGVCGLRPQRKVHVAAQVARKVAKKGKKRRGVLFPRRFSCSSCR